MKQRDAARGLIGRWHRAEGRRQKAKHGKRDITRDVTRDTPPAARQVLAMNALLDGLSNVLAQADTRQDRDEAEALLDAWHALTMAVADGDVTLPSRVVDHLFVCPHCENDEP